MVTSSAGGGGWGSGGGLGSNDMCPPPRAFVNDPHTGQSAPAGCFARGPYKNCDGECCLDCNPSMGCGASWLVGPQAHPWKVDQKDGRFGTQDHLDAQGNHHVYDKTSEGDRTAARGRKGYEANKYTGQV